MRAHCVGVSGARKLSFSQWVSVQRTSDSCRKKQRPFVATTLPAKTRLQLPQPSATAERVRVEQLPGRRQTAPNGGHGLKFSGKLYYLGTFTHKERAAMADDRAPVALCGEYAGLKFSERKYRAKDPTGRQPALWAESFMETSRWGPS